METSKQINSFFTSGHISFIGEYNTDILFSGDAGTGKSFLFKALINAAKYILRESGDFLDQVRVLSLAPSIHTILYFNMKLILICRWCGCKHH